jgi:hypothetical protein
MSFRVEEAKNIFTTQVHADKLEKDKITVFFLQFQRCFSWDLLFASIKSQKVLNFFLDLLAFTGSVPILFCRIFT